MKRYFIIITFVFLSWGTSFADTFMFETEFFYARDTDKQTVKRAGIGGTYGIDKKHMLSLLGGSLKYDDKIGAETFNFIKFHANTPVNDRVTFDGRFTIHESNSWSPFVFGGSVIYAPNDKLRLEIFGDREIVDSPPAIRQKYYINTYGASLDYALTHSFTVVGSYSMQNISDGNDRNIGILKLIYQPAAYKWFTVILANKYLDGEFRSPFYFSPDRLLESLLIARVRKPLWNEKFLLTLRGGIGKQFVRFQDGSDTDKSAWLIEFGLKGWFSDHFGMEALCDYVNNSDTFGAYERYSMRVALRYAF
jgi:hypothetical protein